MKAKFYRVLALIMGLLLVLQATPAWAAIQGDSGVQSVLATISGTVTTVVSQLPSSATLGDGTALPNTTQIGATSELYNGSTLDVARSTAALTDGSASKQLAVGSYRFNGATWDREYGNEQVAGIFNGTFTATQTGPDEANQNFHGVQCVYDVTAVTSVGSFTVVVQGKDQGTSGKYYTLLTTTAVTTTGTNVLTVYPGVTPASTAPNFATSQVLPRTWRVIATYNSGTNQTFTLGCSLIV